MWAGKLKDAIEKGETCGLDVNKVTVAVEAGSLDENVVSVRVMTFGDAAYLMAGLIEKKLVLQIKKRE